MTISKQTEAEILRLYHAEKWRIGTISRELHVHHRTIERILTESGLSLERLRVRGSKADPFIPFIKSTLSKYPKLTGTRLWHMVKERGYTGGVDHFRDIVAHFRPRPIAEAYMRLRTLPGEQAQVDWAHFGTAKFGNAERRLLAFVMVLSWSRHIFLRFYTGDAMPNFVRGHVEAFEYFNSVPREILYDNLRSAVLERSGDAIRFNPQLLELAAHYRFSPKPVAVRKANQKGRVERAIQFARHSFFAARQWKDLEDLNNQAMVWCMNTAGERECPEEKDLTVKSAFERERQFMLILPENPFPSYERKEVQVGKTPFVRFDLNDYSLTHELVRKTVTVLATPDTVKIMHEGKEVAIHKRSYEKGRQIEDPAHLEKLVEAKKEAKRHRGMDRLKHSAASSVNLLQGATQRGHNLGFLTMRLLRYLDLYGPTELEAAIQEVVSADSFHESAVRQVLERRRQERGLPIPVLIDLPHNQKVNGLTVIPHSLADYDRLHAKEENDNVG